MRLDRFLANQGLGTRSQVRGMIRNGRIGVNGEAATDAALHIQPDSTLVLVDGKPLHAVQFLHIMLNKPAGVLTAAQDSRRRTVMDLLPPHAASLGCMPVGRLDIDTEGLLLFTTDGALAHRLLSPKRHVDKVYYARLDARLESDDIVAFSQGLSLGDFTALPARLAPLENGMAALVTLREGKYHQVKRMFQARGKTVLQLKRLSFGGVDLDPSLPPGGWRELTGQEIEKLTIASGGN